MSASFTAPKRDDWATIFALLTDVHQHTSKVCGSTSVTGFVTNRDGVRIMIQAEVAS